MKGIRQRAHELTRGFVALVLALFAVGWLAERAHFAFEPHAYCSDHQRVEHRDSAHVAPAARDAAAALESTVGAHIVRAHAARRMPAFEADDLSEDAHAACCELLGRGDEPVAVSPPTAIAFLPASMEDPCCRGCWSTSPRASVDRVRLAPKQSPPTV